MEKNTYREVMLSAKNGNYAKVLGILQDRIKQLNNEISVNIIVICCNTCVGEDKSKILIHDLVELVILCGSTIENLDKELAKKYLPAVYHILKFLSEKGSVVSFLALEQVLMASFINHQDENLKTLYGSITKLIHNEILKLYSTKDPNISAQDVANLSKISMKLSKNITPIDELLQGYINNYFKMYSHLNVSCADQYECFLFVLDVIVGKSGIKKCLKSVMDLLVVVLNNSFEDGNFESLRSVLNDVVKRFEASNVDTQFIEQLLKFVRKEEDYIGHGELTKALTVNCEILQSHRKMSSYLQSMCRLAFAVISNMAKGYKNFKLEFWNNNLNDDVRILLYKFIRQIGFILSQTEASCIYCNIKKDYVSAVNCTLLSGNILKICSVLDIDVSQESLKQVEQNLEQCCSYVRQLKDTCPKWESSWKPVGIMFYNLSVGLYRQNSKFYSSYTKLLMRSFVSIEGIDGDIVKENILRSCLSSLTEFYFSKNEYKSALIVSAMNIALFPGSRDASAQQWIRIKIASHDSDVKAQKSLQHLNIPSILRTYEMYTKNIYVDFVLKDVDDLLLFEIQQYKALWPNRVSLTSACKELSLTSSPLVAAKGLIKAWADAVSNIPEEMKDIVDTTLEKLEFECNGNIEDPEKIICLGYLYYIKYNVSVAVARKLNTIQVPKENEKCDIICSYECLKLDTFSQVITYLNKSLELFGRHVNTTVLHILKSMNVYNTLVKIANEYRLQCYSLECLQTWLMCLKIARMLSDKLLIIDCAGFIVETANLNAVFVKGLVEEIENEILIMENEDFVKKWRSFTGYYIRLGMAYLNTGDVNMSLNCYHKAVTFYKNMNKQDDLLKISLDYLNWKHMLLPCTFVVEGHYKGALVKPHIILNSITDIFTSDKKSCPYITSLLFEMYQSLVHYYLWLRLPREVRCYCKEVTILSQQLVLPLRSAYCLVYLAQADIMSCRFDDCQVKINGIRDTLCLSKIRTTSLLKKKNTKIDMAVNTLTDDFQAIMLDCSSTSRYNSTSGSPTLLKETFTLPDFVHHNSECHCFQCMNISYKELVLMEINLQAQLIPNSSNNYYKGALNVFNHIVSTQRNFNNKVKSKLNFDLLPDASDVLLEVHCWILLNHRKHLHIDDQEKMLREITVSSKIKYINLHLYNEACMRLQFLKFPAKHIRAVQSSSPNPESVQSKIMPVTPESKLSRVNIPLPSSTKSKPRKTIKKIKFDISDGDGEKDENSPLVQKEFSFAFPHSPLKTPAPNFKIFDQTTVKTSRKKKNENIEYDFASPSIPVTPAEVKSRDARINLRSRTKLLTEKVKSTTTKDLPSIVVTNEDNENVQSTRTRRAIRKNFMNDLTKSTGTCSKSDGDKGAVNKNTRTGMK